MKYGRFAHILIMTVIASGLSGCMKWEYGLTDDFRTETVPGKTLFISNEGNFQYGNASLSCYNTEDRTSDNEIFTRANGQKLGDVAQSLTMYGGKLWIVVNNSGVIFAADPFTFVEKGRITGFTSPRHIHFVNEGKAYVTQIWDSRICIVNPRTYSISGYVETGLKDGFCSTEEMVQTGKYVITNCHTYQNCILKIDTETDKVTDRLEVGLQPADICLDKFGKLWVLTDGGYEGNPAGFENPVLRRIDPDTFTIEKTFVFDSGADPYDLETTPAGDSLLFINGDIWKMAVTDDFLPGKPLIEGGDKRFYAMTVCPYSSEIYVSDAIDWQQRGTIYRYSASGTLTDSFKAGIIPGDFCWFPDNTDVGQ